MNFTRSTKQFMLLFILACIIVVTDCAGIGINKPAAVPQTNPVNLEDYLTSQDLTNDISLIPPPPSAGSVAFALDEEISQKNLALRGTPRWTLATEDANLEFPQAAGIFSCALNAPITEQDTPHLYNLLRRTCIDAGNSTSMAKKYYSRPRPFMVNREPTCTPNAENVLIKNGSYPSGHSAVGWAWALILSEIDPEHTDAIIARGKAFGQSRMICNVHWQSDVIGGSFMGAITVARLHANAIFRSDVEAAKAELAAVRAKGLKPVRDCAAETAAMAN